MLRRKKYAIGSLFTALMLSVSLSGCADEEEGVEVQSSALLQKTPLYRSFLPQTKGGDHFYTTSYQEAVNAQSAGWAYEGVAASVWNGPTGDAVPLLRLWNGGSVSDHFYTTDQIEAANARQHGWISESPPGYSAYVYTYQAPGTCPMHRMVTTDSGHFDHFYTMSWSEVQYMKTHPGCSSPCYNYKYEQIAFFAYPYNASTCPN